MDSLISWVFAAVLFAVVSLLAGADSREPRRACDIHGSWVGLTVV